MPPLPEFISDLLASQKTETALTEQVIKKLLQVKASTELTENSLQEKEEKQIDKPRPNESIKQVDPQAESKPVKSLKPPVNALVPKEFAEIAVKEENGYYVKNAGLVIIAPFLSAFFKVLNLVQDNAFVSLHAQQRAICLLQYLATGNDKSFEEHEMLLNKTLCGLNLLIPLTIDFKITEREREECHALLQAVATNWAALKNTSPEGMREAFFMRDGILEAQANGWNLKIERLTIDVLIDKLPWGISIIKLPWSGDMIFVNW